MLSYFLNKLPYFEYNFPVSSCQQNSQTYMKNGRGGDVTPCGPAVKVVVIALLISSVVHAIPVWIVDRCFWRCCCCYHCLCWLFCVGILSQ